MACRPKWTILTFSPGREEIARDLCEHVEGGVCSLYQYLLRTHNLPRKTRQKKSHDTKLIADWSVLILDVPGQEEIARVEAGMKVALDFFFMYYSRAQS